MDSQVAALLAAQDGVVATPQLTRLGISSDTVSAWVRSGELVRIRRGAFADPSVWEAAEADERYRLTVLAVMRTRTSSEAATHHSALALHQLPLWHVDRRLVVVTADVEETSTFGGLRVMPLRSLITTTEVGGLPALTVPDAVVTTASVSVEGAVVAADQALHDGCCTEADLAEAAERLGPGLRGRRRLRRAISLLDGRAESPGESRTRLVLAALGLPFES